MTSADDKRAALGRVIEWRGGRLHGDVPAKVRALINNGLVHKEAEDRYRVEPLQGSTQIHIVTVLNPGSMPEDLTCSDCQGYAAHGDCSHCKAVREVRAKERRDEDQRDNPDTQINEAW